MKYFKKSMEFIVNEAEDSGHYEEFADNQLSIATKAEIDVRLKSSRQKGRHGWWDEKVCDVEYLYKLRNKAIKDNDHVSVINFTAMIAMRESM